MRNISSLSFAALALALAGCGDSPTQPQPAGPPARNTSSPLTVSFVCRDVGGGGYYYNNTVCNASTSGGAGGNTYHWDVIVISQTDGPNYSNIQGVCTDSYDVSITVRDAAGATATESGSFPCYASSSGGGLEP